jgi:Ran GTPase-activating protein (RanGAP) involved in mRNA processing and transport
MNYSSRKISYDLSIRLGFNNFSTNLIKYLLTFFTLNELIEFKKICHNLYRIISNQNIFKEYMNMIKKITYPKNIVEALFKDNAAFIKRNEITSYLTEEEKEILFQNYLHFFLRGKTHISMSDILRIGENGFYFLSLYLRFVYNKINYLGLGYNLLTEESCYNLGKAIEVNTQLKELHLNGTNLSLECCRILQGALAVNKTIEKLEFSNNNSLRIESLAEIIKGLRENNSITTLFLCDNILRADGARCVAELIKYNRKIHTLYIEKNEFEDEGIKYITEGLKDNMCLDTINLSENRITQLGLEYLYNCFDNTESANFALRKIYLKGNLFNNSESSKILGNILIKNKTIKYLDLCNNNLSDQLITPVANALKDNRSLETLILESNNMGGIGCRILCDGLKHNQTLKYLNIRNNSIGHEGAKAVADMLHVNRTIETLNLQANLLDEHSISLIADKLNYNNIIKLIILSNNQLTNIQDILNNVSFAKDIIMY